MAFRAVTLGLGLLFYPLLGVYIGFRVPSPISMQPIHSQRTMGSDFYPCHTRVAGFFNINAEESPRRTPWHNVEGVGSRV